MQFQIKLCKSTYLQVLGVVTHVFCAFSPSHLVDIDSTLPERARDFVGETYAVPTQNETRSAKIVNFCMLYAKTKIDTIISKFWHVIRVPWEQHTNNSSIAPNLFNVIIGQTKSIYKATSYCSYSICVTNLVVHVVPTTEIEKKGTSKEQRAATSNNHAATKKTSCNCNDSTPNRFNGLYCPATVDQLNPWHGKCRSQRTMWWSLGCSMPIDWLSKIFIFFNHENLWNSCNNVQVFQLYNSVERASLPLFDRLF